jgi:hypothetical protein
MAIVSTTNADDIKTDVRELATIALEDKISKDTIKEYSKWYRAGEKDRLEDRLKHDLFISDIAGINRVSKRYVDKLLSVLSKYHDNSERGLVLHCLYLKVEDTAKKDKERM